MKFLAQGLFLGSILLTSSAFAEVKMGFVDLQRAIQETGAGKKAKAELEKEITKKKAAIEKLEKDLQKMGEDLEKKAMVLSDDVRAQKQAEFQQEMMKYRETAQKSQVDLQKQERDLTLPIIKKLRGIIDDIAKKEKYSMIFEKAEQGVIWAEKDLDLTDRLIKEFDKKK